MTVKAELKIRLLADDVVVAESDDEDLWRRVLGAIQGGKKLEDTPSGSGEPKGQGGGGADGAVEVFAEELEVSASEVLGACGPEWDAPFLRLDERSWEAFKKNMPARGRGAVGPVQLVGTLLCLWFKHAGIQGRPTQAHAHTVLATIGLTDPNASRSIKNCDWLQGRPDGILINPAQHSRAISVARAYVTRKPIQAE